MSTGKERANMALGAMEALGLDRRFIIPILRELLKVYNNEWSYIEAENYRLLADQAFEKQESAPLQNQGSISPRRTRSSTSSPAAIEKGKKPISSERPNSPAQRPLKEEREQLQSHEVAVRRSLESYGEVPKPPLFAKVKIEKGANAVPGPDVEIVDLEDEEHKATHLGQSTTSSFIPTPRRRLDALEEPLRQVVSPRARSSLVAEPSTKIERAECSNINLQKEKARSERTTDNRNSVEAPQEAEPHGKPDPTGENHTGPGPISGGRNYGKVAVDTSLPLGDASNPLMGLLNYSDDDEDEPSLALQANEFKVDDLVPLLTHSSGVHKSVEDPQEDPQEKPVEVIELEDGGAADMQQLVTEELPKHVCALSELAIGTPEGIRPRFILNKKEGPTIAGENEKAISALLRQDVEATATAPKRTLPPPEDANQLKRVKHDSERLSSPRLPSGCFDHDKVGLKASSSSEDKMKCVTPPAALTVSKSASTRRKNFRVIADSPSPEAKHHVTSGGSELDMNGSLPAGTVISKRGNGRVAPKNSDLTISARENNEIERADSIKGSHFPADISRGTEKVAIPFVNEYNSDTIPASFKYISGNTVFEDAYVKFSLARVGEEDCCGTCLGNCLEAPFPCTCTRETGGVFAYTRDGLLKDEYLQHEVNSTQDEELKEQLLTFCQSGWDCPHERIKGDLPENCKGHLSRKFIKECWHKCGCHMDCGNRVVQRGISRRIQIFFTQQGKGWGLRTLEELPAGAFVCEYVGEIMTNIELYHRNHARASSGSHTYPIALDGDWCSEKGLKDEEALCLDATNFGNAARFINHRCFDANLIDMPVTIESPDRHYYHVAFFTSRAVRAMEELTWDYKIDFEDDDHPIEAFKCLCESPFCRGSSEKNFRKIRKGSKKHQ